MIVKKKVLSGKNVTVKSVVCILKSEKGDTAELFDKSLIESPSCICNFGIVAKMYKNGSCVVHTF